jgi:septation ring formation regulator EzrA
MKLALTNSILEIHVSLFIACLLLTVLIGFLIGKRKVNQLKKRILDVEDEMLHSNNEVLHYATINKQLTETLEKAKIAIPTIERRKEEEKLRSIPLGKIG